MKITTLTIISTLASCFLCSCSEIAGESVTMNSPGKNLSIFLDTDESSGEIFYSVLRDSDTVINEARLGVAFKDQDFTKSLEITDHHFLYDQYDQYELIHGKNSSLDYHYNSLIVSVQNRYARKMEIEFRVSDDGVGFRYIFPNEKEEKQVIIGENTHYSFEDESVMWAQHAAVPKTGWNRTNPSYEEEYSKNVDVNTESPSGYGWVYPLLVKSGNNWILISEAGVPRNYCGTRLEAVGNQTLKVSFPPTVEQISSQGTLPVSTTQWASPWRILVIGDLSTIVESNLGTDLALPNRVEQTDFVNPGLASWSWAKLKDASITYGVQKEFIDYASKMQWPYCLVDVNWDSTIGYDKVHELSEYARSKNVRLLLWYNSAGDWNDVTYHPKDKLLTHESRMQEFTKLNEMGIAGIKVDFFAGDGQSVMAYYHDILADAAAKKLLVNFHGTTLPRGWQRTYPNLMTVEAIKGFEFITFSQEFADKVAEHCAILPFTRNVFDPMDFTPMSLSAIPNIERRTTAGFELALPIIYYSGIQHIAETPAGMTEVDDSIVDMLKALPAGWDETKFIEGFPGDYVVMARRSGNTWYIGGINAEKESRSIDLDLSFMQGGEMELVTDSDESALVYSTVSADKDSSISLNLKPKGGFLLKVTR